MNFSVNKHRITYTRQICPSLAVNVDLAGVFGGVPTLLRPDTSHYTPEDVSTTPGKCSTPHYLVQLCKPHNL